MAGWGRFSGILFFGIVRALELRSTWGVPAPEQVSQTRAAHPLTRVRKGAVIFERKNTANTLFEAKSLLKPAVHSVPETKTPALLKSAIARPPEFLVQRKFFRTSWFSRLGTILC